MKKLIFIFIILFYMGGYYASNVMGQYKSQTEQRAKIGKNISRQPAWGPVGYNYTMYYYIPRLNIYFDVNSSLFYYKNGDDWLASRMLDRKYGKYDFYRLYKVVVQESKPWNNNKRHKKLYSKYKRNKKQIPIRDSNEEKYEKSKKNLVPWAESR